MANLALVYSSLMPVLICVTSVYLHPFNGPFPGLPGSAGTRKVKPIWMTEARDNEWQWHQLGHMQVCTSLQTDNHASTPPLKDGCPSCRPTNSVIALKAAITNTTDTFRDCAGIS